MTAAMNTTASGRRSTTTLYARAARRPPLDATPTTWHRAGMAGALLFGALALGLLVIAWSAWRGGLTIAAIGALVLGLWLVAMAVSAFRRR